MNSILSKEKKSLRVRFYRNKMEFRNQKMEFRNQMKSEIRKFAILIDIYSLKIYKIVIKIED